MEFFSIQWYCLMFVILGNVENKKYDVDLEAQKLFGQNLAAVLTKFRRTSDYVKILTSKIEDMENEMVDVRIQILNQFEMRMNNKIQEMFGLDTKPTTEVSASSPGYIRQRKKTGARRQDEDPERQKKIDRIDNYNSSPLSVKQRNEFKDLAFKYAGDAIHSLIEKMGLGDDEIKSTQMPDGGQPPGLRSKTTTEHARDHQVTKEPKIETTAALGSEERRRHEGPKNITT